MAERQSRSRLQRKESAMFKAPDKAPNLSNTSKHRRQAADCGLLAANAQSAGDRTLLLHLQRSLLDRAEWLDGLPPVPPAPANALAVPRRS
jgi:hypothetical protein